MSSYSTGTLRQFSKARTASKASETGDSSIGLSVATLLKNMIGAGIFSLPIGLKHASPLPGMAILGAIGLLSAGSYWMIGHCCITWGVTSFRELWNRVLGRRSAWIIDVTIFLNGWITLVCYIVLIGDFTTKSFDGLLGADHFLARSRVLNQSVITLAVLLPLSLAEDLKALAFTSVLGLGVLVYVVVLVIRDSWLHRPAEWGFDVSWKWQMGAFEAIALYTHAFVAHYNAPKVFSELINPTHARWTVLVLAAYGSAFLIYANFAWAGLCRFEDSVEGNILRNYGPEFFVLLAWLGMGFSIAFTYPLVFNSTREAAVNLTLMIRENVRSVSCIRTLLSSPKFQQLRRGYMGSSLRHRSLSLVSLLGPSPDTSDKKMSHKPGKKATIALVFLTLVIAVTCDDVGIVNALAGAVMGCMVCLVLPGLLFFHTVRLQLRQCGPAEGGLKEPLLSHGKCGTGDAAQRLRLRIAMCAGLITILAGLAFAIIGTAVILSRL
eukprot:TRINITY_DN42328_c0_g1_i1.p1 TRINITY_DN42328_c0_g1~~TRINITY_DN42328_c0_g1_i1.p1  ORF type:complete len:494 (+),score=62.16 TRINITY_DN42328_c0_g1_i1:66-1547(+)